MYRQCCYVFALFVWKWGQKPLITFLTTLCLLGRYRIRLEEVQKTWKCGTPFVGGVTGRTNDMNEWQHFVKEEEVVIEIISHLKMYNINLESMNLLFSNYKLPQSFLRISKKKSHQRPERERERVFSISNYIISESRIFPPLRNLLGAVQRKGVDANLTPFKYE